MILLISTCKYEFHKLEFVKPVEDILKMQGKKFKTVDYKKIKKSDLSNCKKAIICGTSLLDNEYLDNIGKFSWIKSFNKPLLGICAGMQVMGLNFRCSLKKFRQIGMMKMRLKKPFFNVGKEINGYSLHGKCLIVNKRDFGILASNRCAQIIQHKTKPFYGTLFHPEVRNKEIIENFVK
jgi:GMP synthase-like glutamine amidotransferase